MFSHSCRLALALAWTVLALPGVFAQGTAFSYQGRLTDNGQPATGNYDITFTLFAYSQYGFPVGPVLTNLNTPITAGGFSTMLDFGAVFNGSNYWLEIAVRTNGNGYFTILEPRQPVTPVPYAVFSANASNAVNAVTALTANTAASAASVPASGISGTISTANLGSNVALLTANGTLPASVLPTNLASPGGIAWQSPSATTLQAQPNTGYVLTNSQQVTITLPATPNVGDIVEIAGAGLGGWVLAQNPGQTVAASFTPLVLSGDVFGNWNFVASSSDGTKLAAAAGYGGGIWTSSNSGTNWVQTSAPTNPTWISIASSSDGMKLAAGGEGGGIWTSSNSGTNWVQTSAPTSETWTSIASSSDGSKLGALVYVGGIWISSNSGTNWAQTSAPTNAAWYSIASSSDGTKLAAVASAEVDESGGGIWTSSNSGTNWLQTSAPTNLSWRAIASSSDGSKLAAVAINYGIWTSSNSGTNWMQTSTPTSETWYCIASSSDGTKLAAPAYGGAIWTSSNSGPNWAQISGPWAEWWSIASSSDGTKLAAGISGGGIWTFLNGVVITQSASASGLTMLGTEGFLEGYSEGNAGSVVELVYAGGGQFVALYQTGSFSGH